MKKTLWVVLCFFIASCQWSYVSSHENRIMLIKKELAYLADIDEVLHFSVDPGQGSNTYIIAINMKETHGDLSEFARSAAVASSKAVPGKTQVNVYVKGLDKIQAAFKAKNGKLGW